MVIDAIFEPGITGLVCAGLAFENDGAPVRQDQTCPDQQHAALPEGDTAVVFTDEARSLGDQQEFSGWTVIDMRRHLGRNLSGKV